MAIVNSVDAVKKDLAGLDAMQVITNTLPTPGQLVAVRQRRYVVTRILDSPLPSPSFATPPTTRPQHLLHLQSIDDDGLGEELVVLWEVEPGTQIFERTLLPDPARGLDDPALLDAFLDAVRWSAVASADVRSFHAPFRSGITIEDYQLEPLVRAVEMPRVSLLIADDVGLGKTIEAGLVAQELLLRYRARTLLVVCPAGLQIQWRDQMRDKFGLELRIIDTEALRELRRRRGLGVNPWTQFPRLITSIDYLKRDRAMRLFREALPAPGESTYPRRFDLLIVDEAHNVAPAGRGNYAIDSQRTDCIRTLAPHFEHKLFLTATPHNGYTESFSALLELLDDQRFHRGMALDRAQLDRVLVRRLKSELPKDNLGRPRFAPRSLEAIEVDFPADEQHAHDLLQQYARLRSASDGDDDKGSHALAAVFVMKLLKKRLFSSPEAFHLTLRTHLESVTRGGAEKSPTKHVTEGILRREIERVEEDFVEDDLYEEETDSLVRTTSQVLRPLSKAEQEITGELLTWSERASATLDAKAKALFSWLDSNVRPEGKWTETRVIVFTEYRATQKWLEGKLAARGFTHDERLLTLYGGMSPDDRERIKHAFQADPTVSKVRILLATDAASEGIDLQNHCSRLFHYEVPWNPNRMEQRNGRVDRHGQKAERVEIFHFVGKGWREQRAGKDADPGSLAGDLEFLFRAARKVDQIREDLGNVGEVIQTQIEEAMLGRRRKLEPEKTARRSSAAKKMITFERQLAERLRKLTERLGESRRALHLDPEAVRAVVDTGLVLAGHPQLQPWEMGTQRVWMVPELRGTWASCLEGLRHPHTGQKRPVTFDEELARGRDDIVLAHLGHKLVQLCVGLLRAEMWAPESQRKLSRVSARVVTKMERPMLIAYARLVVLGGDNGRLHEEVIVAGGEIDGGKFVRSEPKALGRALDQASRELPRRVPLEVEARLVEQWPEHRAAVEAALEAHARGLQDGLRSHLEARCKKEIGDHEAVLRELERALQEELTSVVQLELFDTREREQWERNRESMRARLVTVDGEIRRETEAIRARYGTLTPRLFPVAISYLVPLSQVGRMGG
jgi:SNF2 family DNA or RNA helicase